MATRHAQKEERAEAAAREAADELSKLNQERRETESRIAVSQEPPKGSGGGGVLGGMLTSVQETLGHAKDMFTGKAQETAEKTGEYKDYTAEKAKETKDSASERTRGATEVSAQKAKEGSEKMGEYKVSAAEKAKETKDAAAEKAKQAKDTTVGTMGEYKEKYQMTEDEARSKMQELKIQEEGAAGDVDRLKAKGDRETAADRGIAARENIYGGAGISSVLDSIKEKLTMPRDVKDETLAATKYGGSKRVVDESAGAGGMEVDQPTSDEKVGQVTREDFAGVKNVKDDGGVDVKVVKFFGSKDK